MKINIYSVCWNEEHMLPYYFKHYKPRFPNANFIIYDNMSDDRSKEIIEYYGGTVVPFDTNNEFREEDLIEIRNNCWKDSNADWVLISDVDEFLYCDESHLKHSEANFIKGEGYEMVGISENPETITQGVRNHYMDKAVLFKPSEISEMNYSAGSHQCNPVGKLIREKERVILKHFKYISVPYVLKRYADCAVRLSNFTKQNNWNIHYHQKEEQTKNVHKSLMKRARDVPYSLLRLRLYNRLILYNRKYGIFNKLKWIGIKKPFV